jgi:hypothetical protein
MTYDLIHSLGTSFSGVLVSDVLTWHPRQPPTYVQRTGHKSDITSDTMSESPTCWNIRLCRNIRLGGPQARLCAARGWARVSIPIRPHATHTATCASSSSSSASVSSEPPAKPPAGGSIGGAPPAPLRRRSSPPWPRVRPLSRCSSPFLLCFEQIRDAAIQQCSSFI